ncbi:MAG: hypothetical protein OXG37_14475 [Actinomycetia bacterium]|nr:hypothetical protein [Actinomycetes bacterium]
MRIRLEALEACGLGFVRTGARGVCFLEDGMSPTSPSAGKVLYLLGTRSLRRTPEWVRST